MRAVNLLPREDPRRRRKRPTVVIQLALVSPFLVVSLLAAGYLMANSKVRNDKTTLQALQRELAALPQPSTPQVAGSLVDQRNQRVAALASALQTRVAWDRILSEISAVLPQDVWLTTLAAQSPQTAAATAAAAAAAAAAPPPSAATTTTTTASSGTTTIAPAPTPAAPEAPLTLDGYTYSQEGVARFLSRLAVIPELQDVKLIQSTQTPLAGQLVVSFQIQASVRPQAAS
jgi:Tfp pilus assembly protein PilN